MFSFHVYIWLLTWLRVNHSLDISIGNLHISNNGVRAIMKGTKWCGTGNIAENDDDLGKYQALDSCCRSHDKCPDSMAAGEKKHGLANRGVFTSSHCDCDYAFFDCLNAVNSTVEENRTAYTVGDEYFNDLNVKCFNYTVPAVCTHPETRLKWISILPLVPRKCTQYQYNDGEMKWQWFDVPFFD